MPFPSPDWQSLIRAASAPQLLEALFDRLPDVVFFVKDRSGRYVMVNDTLVRRRGILHKEQLLGHTADQVFPPPLGPSYAAQDRLVLQRGVEIVDKLELHFYRGGGQGWCLTFKSPLRNADNDIIGLIGISRDLPHADAGRVEYQRLARAIEHLKEHYAEPLRLEALARSVGLGMDPFERLVKEVFGLTPRQLLIQTRIDAASTLLRDGQQSISEIAHACGYADHSAFSRQFRITVGTSPRALRKARI
jgi:PAS domain S-box-containing protein